MVTIVASASANLGRVLYVPDVQQYNGKELRIARRSRKRLFATGQKSIEFRMVQSLSISSFLSWFRRNTIEVTKCVARPSRVC
jgi:hypothetical protein